MLPLQMHQMGQTPPHQLDPLAAFQGPTRHDHLTLHHPSRPSPRHAMNPYQASLDASLRAFTIRSSSSSQGPHPPHHRLSASFSHHLAEHADHQLRRKTPSGTIDAGYDGTPTQLAAGPPPLKHMALPGSSNIFPTAVVRHGAQPSPGGTWPFPSPPINGDGENQSNLVAAKRLSLGTWGSHGQAALGQPSGLVDRSAVLQPLPQNVYHGGLGIQPGPGHLYPHGGDPTMFSPGGFGPNPMCGVGGHPGLSGYRSPGPLEPGGYVPHNTPYDSAFAGPLSPFPQGAFAGHPFSHGHTFRMPASALSLDDGFSQHAQGPSLLHSPHRRMESLSLDPAPTPAGQASPAQFKERALAHAHRTYADLLVCLSRTKKAFHHAKSASGSRAPSKMVVYPRPTKQLSTSLGPRPHAGPQGMAAGPAGFTYNPAQNGTPRGFGGSAMAEAGQAARRSNVGNPYGHPSPAASMFGGPAAHGYPYAGNGHQGHPVANAKASLEILTSLCEQSGWKWVDGMLLGGCLQYGLEHYERALDWFQRIINLDSSHVEAISNIAATLYCLNRHEEAERHWLQAVKLRPSYLEAVEHLAGLLCSNHRGREAVDIINFVQRSLRIPTARNAGAVEMELGSGPDASGGSSTETQGSDDAAVGVEQATVGLSATSAGLTRKDGYGSSGYSVPGSENGRMLLLVHAKGNMLYALKEIDGASEAFQEAVLISAGRKLGGIQALIQRIQTVLSPRNEAAAPDAVMDPRALSAPLLLPPERAKRAAELVFANTRGQLPGLRYLVEGGHRKTAIATTSNSLLSLAKIFQDAISSGASCPGLSSQPSGVGDILALYYLSLSLQESPSTANNVGILLASVQQTSAQRAPAAGEPASQAVPGIAPGSGLALALAYYNYGLNLDPKHVHLHTNLGSLLKDIGQLDLAIQMYEQAVACDGTFDIALTNLANAVKDRGRVSDAIIYYKRAVAANPDFAEAVCGLSTALNSVCDWRGRGGVVLYGGAYDRWHVDSEGMISDVLAHGQGGGLMKRVVGIVGRQLKDASSWGAGTLQGSILPLLASQLRNAGPGIIDGSLDVEAELRRWAGQPWEGSRILRLIERATRATMRAWYQDKYVKGAESPAGYRRVRPPSSLSVPAAPTVLPFHTFTCPLTAKDVRMISQRNALRISCSTLRSPWLPSSVYPPPRPPAPQLNVGYISSDFNNHPLAHLMQSVFGLHDPQRAKAFCYATTASDRSVHRQQIEREAPVFRDVSTWSSDRLVNQIIQDGIHILVNLNGYTRGARNEIFAARPAPIQMSFMGFAGTLGAEWCDYLLADTTAIPPETLRPWRSNLGVGDVFRDEADVDAEDWVYSENVIYCRDTFFCCDHRQSADAAERAVTWEGEQRRRWKMRKELFPHLPDDTIILGNFNQLYKIDPTTFRTWLRILSNVPRAVLWLLRFPELGESNLRRTAKLWAGESVASRIVFTDVAPKQQHISRARVCDLFLDTPECNAHTTAADVLWSSTPLLTLPRYKYKMCSRMAASILRGALPKSPAGERAAEELIAGDDAAYEEAAVRLANGLSYRAVPGTSPGEGPYGEGSGRLAEVRRLLFESRWTCGLFDTRRWVRDLEDAYEEAWRRWVDGAEGDIYL